MILQTATSSTLTWTSRPPTAALGQTRSTYPWPVAPTTRLTRRAAPHRQMGPRACPSPLAYPGAAATRTRATPSATMSTWRPTTTVQTILSAMMLPVPAATQAFCPMTLRTTGMSSLPTTMMPLRLAASGTLPPLVAVTRTSPTTAGTKRTGFTIARRRRTALCQPTMSTGSSSP